jgi:hypothetical protein
VGSSTGVTQQAEKHGKFTFSNVTLDCSVFAQNAPILSCVLRLASILDFFKNGFMSRSCVRRKIDRKLGMPFLHDNFRAGLS